MDEGIPKKKLGTKHGFRRIEPETLGPTSPCSAAGPRTYFYGIALVCHSMLFCAHVPCMLIAPSQCHGKVSVGK